MKNTNIQYRPDPACFPLIGNFGYSLHFDKKGDAVCDACGSKYKKKENLITEFALALP
jgi:hypothetical protein